ncbi:MAG: sulfate permease, SulP family, partial [Anaerocolumna sp.]|nr:sulfate permease, SulP family [Anaerocolumna sp.]
IAGFFISFLGGSRVQIGGPTGAFVVIVYGIVAQYGIEGLTIATIMAGVFMIFFGFMRFGSIIKFVPYPITTGFTSGIAVVLLSTQIKDFLGLSIKEVPSEFIPKWQSYISHFSTIHLATTLVGIGSLLIIIFWPKINKTIPGSLVALIIATLVVKLFNLPVETIGSRFGEISNSISFIKLSDLHISISVLKKLIHPAITIAFLASIESLLSAVVADGMIGKKHNSNMELIAARTAANVKNGGRTPIAGIVHALTLLLIMLIFMPLAKLIPMTTLAAILVVVSYNMSEWRSFKDLLKSTKSDISVLLVTFLFTILFDLVVAIKIGMVIAMFLFIRRMSDSTRISDVSMNYQEIFNDNSDEDDDATTTPNLREHLNSKIFLYEINGPLFFGATNTFLDVMNEINSDSSVIIFKMNSVPHMDATAFNALKRIEKRCREKDILLLYSELNEQPIKLLKNAGFVTNLGEDRFFDTTESAIKYANEFINCTIESVS